MYNKNELKIFLIYIFIFATVFSFAKKAQAGITNVTNCGTLSVANETYVLQNDVVSDKSCFLFASTGITLDLNGHTITYADMAIDGVENPGFEEGDPNDANIPIGWDLSGAHGNAVRQSYLNKLFYDEYSLKITNVAGDANIQEYVLSSPVYLPQPGKYAITAEVQGGGYNILDSHLEVDGYSVSCSNTISNMHMSYAGDMAWGLICEFDINEPKTVKAKIVVGTKDETKSVFLNVDEVDIRPIALYGIAPSGYNISMVEIKNGTITEGRSKAIYSSAIKRTGASKIHDLSIITNGINSQNIDEYWNGGLEIYNNYMEAKGKLPLNRQYPFSMIELGRTSGGNKIYNNILMNGPHVGISHGNATGGILNPNRSEIYGNTIKTKINATNGFAISAGSNIDIHDNLIQPIQGHGIGLGRDSDNVKIYNNLIEPRTWPCSEYSTYSYPNSAHGIRIKNYGSGSLQNLEIFNNTIIGKTNPQLSNCYTEVSGITNYLQDDSGGVISENVKIHDNYISVQTDNYLQQHVMAYKSQGQGEIYNNVFKSNHIILDMSDNDAGGAVNYKKFYSNTLEKASNPQGFHALRYGYQKVGDNEFTNTALAGGADLRDISLGINGGGVTYANYTNLTVSWFLNLSIKDAQDQPIENVSILIKDKDNNIIKEIFSDIVGVAAEKLSEYIYNYKSSSLNGYINSTPYQLIISKSGYKNAVVDLNLDSSKEIDVVLQTAASQSNSSFSVSSVTVNPTTYIPIENCSDGVQNQDESDIDCGGVCGSCQGQTDFSGPSAPNGLNII